MPRVSTPHLVSLGYEGRNAAELIETLKAERVTVLADVRLTPISRKPGLSKTALSEALHEAGIHYVHYRELGNPKENREGYRAGDAAALEAFDKVLQSSAGRAALRHVSELLDDGVVALLCFERDHSTCHRSQVADELAHLCSGLQVTYA